MHCKDHVVSNYSRRNRGPRCCWPLRQKQTRQIQQETPATIDKWHRVIFPRCRLPSGTRTLSTLERPSVVFIYFSINVYCLSRAITRYLRQLLLLLLTFRPSLLAQMWPTCTAPEILLLMFHRSWPRDDNVFSIIALVSLFMLGINRNGRYKYITATNRNNVK